MALLTKTKPKTADELAADETRRQKAAEAAKQKAADIVEDKAVAKAEDAAESRGVGTVRVVALKTWHCNFINEVYDLTKGEQYTIPKDLFMALTNPLLPGPVVQMVV